MWQPWRLCLDLTCRRRSPFICEECNELTLSSSNTGGSATMFETTLFPGSSQPVTDHCRGTGPGLCWLIALWAICVLDWIVGWGETAQSCTANSFSPSPFLPPLIFPGCQTNTGICGFSLPLLLLLPATFHKYYLQQVFGTLIFVMTSAS